MDDSFPAAIRANPHRNYIRSSAAPLSSVSEARKQKKVQENPSPASRTEAAPSTMKSPHCRFPDSETPFVACSTRLRTLTLYSFARPELALELSFAQHEVLVESVSKGRTTVL